MKKFSLKKLEKRKMKIKKNSLVSFKGGSSTTLMVEVGVAENEYEDSNGNGKFDEGDKFVLTINT